MKSLHLVFRALCACAIVAAINLRAEFIQPVAVTVTNGEGAHESLINGDGLDDGGLGSPTSTHAPGTGQWSSIGSIRESATFDLGQSVSLTKIYVWNYNAAGATDIGMKEVQVQVSAGTDPATANFNTIAIITLTEGGTTAQTFDIVGTNVRLVRLKGVSNWGHGYSVGLAEVRFESGAVTGRVPVVTMSSPVDGDEIAFGRDIILDAAVTDADGDLQKVEYFDGATLLTNRVAAPYAVTLRNQTQGEHAYKVQATDRSGKTSWVTVNVNIRELVADRIVKLDDTEDEGAELNQITYSGAWTLAQGNTSDPRYKNNDHYNLGNNRVDYFEVRFVGVKIDLFGTVASHHGTAWASVDGGPESRVNYKATLRKEQAFVWGSPILANREHVLRVRVAGDGVVTADRFDVSVSDKPDLASAKITAVSFNQVVAQMEDAGASIVDETSLALFLNGVPVSAAINKSGALTTIAYTPSAPFAPGSSHTLRISGKDKSGAALNSELIFNLPAPYFPLTGLGGPSGTAGGWGVRQIWGAGRIDAIVSAASVVAQAQQPGFVGQVKDFSEPVINFGLSANPGTGGLFPGDLPFPAEANGLSENDFVIIARANVEIPTAGDWTIGIHSDDGFALRFIGAPFASVSGNGVHDENFPEYIGFLTGTGDSNTRGVLTGLAAGTYAIEFIGFQRTAGSFFEIYAAEGAFADDVETDQWQLIGSESGLRLMNPPTQFRIQSIASGSGGITLEFDTPSPDAAHQLLASADLRTWRPVTGVTTTKLAAPRVRATFPPGPDRAMFYRIALP